MNPDFGLRTLDPDGYVIRIVTKIELIGPWAMPYPSKTFRQNPFTTFSVIRRTDRVTDGQMGYMRSEDRALH